MLADQSILQKSRKETDNSTSYAGTNITSTSSSQSAVTSTTPINSTAATATKAAATSAAATSATPVPAATVNAVSQKTPLIGSVPAPKPLPDPNVATMTRIGSIGRTTIACITPAGIVGKNTINNGGVGVVSAAALAAAGVELDTVDESMTEVIVKIENTATSDEETITNNEEEQNDLSYDLHLSSPMSWAYDTIKIENEEEFEDILCGAGEGEGDGDTMCGEDDDDLLTTAAASTKQANANVAGMIGVRTRRSRSFGQMQEEESTTPTTTTIKRRSVFAQSTTQQQQPQQQTEEQQKRLLEQQQHLQHLNLQPNQPLKIKLASIPATITSIAPKPSNVKNEGKNPGNPDFTSSLSEDKRYRILVQNQRMRKESLEHSEDMLYDANNEKPWVCRNCHRNYKWKNSLKCHLKNECGQPPRYFCSKLCGYATNVHSNLKRHLNTKCRDKSDDDMPATRTNNNVAINSGVNSGGGSGGNTSSTMIATSTTSLTTNSATYTLVLSNQD